MSLPGQSTPAAKVERVVRDIADRLEREPDLDDFLTWWGGTLEYWIHVCIAAVARREAWSARSEVPYITAAPAVSAKTPVKWADGAVVWPDGLAALFEVKTIPYRKQLGAAATAIPTDLAALIAADWPATLAHQQGSDQYTDKDWWSARNSVRNAIGVQLALVHGSAPLPPPDEAVNDGVRRGTNRLLNRHAGSTGHPEWLRQTVEAVERPALRIPLRGHSSAAVLLAWHAPIPTV